MAAQRAEHNGHDGVGYPLKCAGIGPPHPNQTADAPT